MLVLSRKQNQRIRVGDQVVVTVVPCQRMTTSPKSGCSRSQAKAPSAASNNHHKKLR